MNGTPTRSNRRSPTRALLRILSVASLAALLVVGCGSDDSGSDGSGSSNTTDATTGGTTGGTTSTGTTAGPSCTEGFLGCDCIDGVACFPGSDWICDNGTCREPACDQGDEGCACFANNTCNDDPNTGQPLLCDDGVCSPMDCPSGTMGCPCVEGSLCGDGLECVVIGSNAQCAPESCEAGSQGCVCNEDRTCDAGLACEKNACVPTSCRLGSLDCLCKADLSCDAGLECDGDTERCVEIGCTVGTLGCDCDAGACQASGAVCNSDGVCEPANCVSGQEGCACDSNGACAVSEDGERLFCEGGLCRSEDCAPGEPGCSCEDGYLCDDGAVCASGTCVEQGCEAGSLNCSCQGGDCLPGLRCGSDNVCEDATGYISGPCFEDDTCNRGGRCDDDVCIRCTLGTPGCGCDDADSCFSGALCLGALCVAESDIPPELPDELTCYTPCLSSVVINGVRRECTPDGLMEGCVGSRSCDEGSCVLPGEDPAVVAACDSELDCPDFQTCIGGQCYSECKASDECGEGLRCFNHVCRVGCDTEDNFCPQGYSCQTQDADNGYCIPNVATEGSEDDTTNIDGSYTITTQGVNMTNVSTNGVFSIINSSDTFQTFTIRKKSHYLQSEGGGLDRAVRASDGVIENCDEDEELCFCTDDDGANPCEDDAYNCVNGACRPAQCSAGTCPMFWLSLYEGTEFLNDDLQEDEIRDEIEVGLEAGQGARINFGLSGDVEGVRWQGVLEVISQGGLGNRLIDVNYNEVPEGQWAGEMTYLATFGTDGVDEWSADFDSRDSNTAVLEVGNALIRRWSAFRRGQISWDEFQAVLTATETGSWDYPNVVDACNNAERCYLYDIGASGVSEYSSDLDTVPIPTGATQLPFAMNLRVSEDNTAMLGRIESSKALQYAGNPAIELNLHNAPDQCDRNAFGACLLFIDDMEATIRVGGRYQTDSGDTNCSERPDGGYSKRQLPWLVEGFLGDASYDSETDLYYVHECRDSALPFTSEDPEELEALMIENSSLTASNPIPDGRSRVRTFRLIDGVIVNQTDMFILFEERFESFLSDDDESFSSYGYMKLRRRSTDLDLKDTDGNLISDVFEGVEHTDDRDEPNGVLEATCSEELLETILGFNGSINSGNVVDVVTALIDGVPSSASPTVIDASSREEVHYLCEDTGLIDGGPDNGTPHYLDDLANNNSCGFADNGVCEDGGSGSEFSVCDLGTDLADCGRRTSDDQDVQIECPAGSNVIFFTVDKTIVSQQDIADLDCQTSADGCRDQLNNWLAAADPIVQSDPIWRCTEDRAYCDDNRTDLRDGKDFYVATEAEALFVPLQVLIDDAFRYKTRFQNRDGGGIGFTPDICDGDSNLTPYCFDPTQIEEIQERIDCLLQVHNAHYSDLSGNATVRDKLNSYLMVNFSYATERRADNSTITHDGFERQLSQLLIMLGDDSYTKAFASRFDLAASNVASFEGTLFEQNGLDLSGAVGFEMVSLYKAAQYYQMVLDRFYSMSPAIWSAFQYAGNSRNFVTTETVSSYFDRVIRASTQKATTWSEIAKRYQNLGEPVLARQVAERAYAATYLESIVMSRIMLRAVEAGLPSERAQIRKVIEDAHLRYASALRNMQNVHSTINDEITIFGFAPDYVPFPALDSGDFRQSNAFERILTRVRTKLQIAREREDSALSQSREFETNQAQFQSELNQIRINYENQLGDLCGTFEASGRIYPAIKKYAYLDERATLLGDPCGFMGNGQIHEALAAFDELAIEAQQITVQQNNVLEEVEIERNRVAGQCGEILEAADFLYGECKEADPSLGIPFGDDIAEAIGLLDPFDPEGGCLQAEINNLQEDIRDSQFVNARMQTVQNMASTLSQTTNDFKYPVYLVGTLAAEAVISINELDINNKQTEIDEIERYKMKWQTENECDLAKVESTARTQTILLRLNELELEALRLEHRTKLALSALERLRNQAQRLQLEQQETEQLTINVQAAHNNPNVRIYKNDAIINAEIAFEDAIREVYRLTRVFEYYTSQSYENKDDLFLIRMIARGDINLENYVNELDNAFYSFEELFGVPEPRVKLISLKNDILAIPRTDEDGRALSDSERVALMREKLADKTLLDKNGYLTLPFSTDVADTSPLTRVHKIYYIEADVYGNDVGDFIGRIYVRQRGTSAVRGVEDGRTFYRFDERTSVINTMFGGVRFFQNEANYYKSFRLRDRPFVNTHWELVINQRDELDNMDINLNSLTDLRLYVFYTDFTVF